MTCLKRYEVEFISLVKGLIGSNLELRPNPNTIDYAGYFVYDVTKSAMDSFYEDYKKCRDITPEIIKEFFKLTVYQMFGHSYEHPWHLLAFEKEFWEDLCPTHDSIDYELTKLRNQVLGRETVAERPMGYSLLNDTCRSDSFKIYRLNKSIEYYRQAHLTYTEEQIQAGIRSIRHAIDSLEGIVRCQP